MTAIPPGLNGFVQALIKKFPPLAHLLNTDVGDIMVQGLIAAMQGTPWDNTAFQAKLAGTKWWNETPANLRDWTWTQLVDPASARKDVQQMSTKVIQVAGQLGLPLSSQQIQQFATEARANQWDDNTLQFQLAQQARANDLKAGSIETNQTAVRQMAYEYGMPVSNPTAFQWAQKISEGSADVKGFEEYARQQAIAQHPYWEKQLGAGLTVRQLADPYIQNAAKLLETSPDQINLTDPKWNFATTAKDGTKSPMSQSQWQTQIMSDPKYGWDKTDNAKQAAYGMAQQIEQTFGAVK